MGEFENNIISIYGAQGKKYLQNLPNLIEEISNLWQLSELKILDNLSFNYVLSGVQKNQQIILKLGIDHESLQREADAINAFHNKNMVKLLDKKKGILLLEKIIDGVSLKSSFEKNKIKICCDLVKSFYTFQVPKEHIFLHINDQLKIIDKNWDIPNEYLDIARKLKKKLLDFPNQKFDLLHGDLHLENILRSGEKWKIIDPKGVIGMKINEVWAFVTDFEPDAQFIANYFNWDVNLVRDWYFVQVVMAALWNIEDNVNPNIFLNLIEKIYPNFKGI